MRLQVTESLPCTLWCDRRHSQSCPGRLSPGQYCFHAHQPSEDRCWRIAPCSWASSSLRSSTALHLSSTGLTRCVERDEQHSGHHRHGKNDADSQLTLTCSFFVLTEKEKNAPRLCARCKGRDCGAGLLVWRSRRNKRKWMAIHFLLFDSWLTCLRTCWGLQSLSR